MLRILDPGIPKLFLVVSSVSLRKSLRNPDPERNVVFSDHMSDGKYVLRDERKKTKPLFRSVFGQIWLEKNLWNNGFIFRYGNHV